MFPGRQQLVQPASSTGRGTYSSGEGTGKKGGASEREQVFDSSQKHPMAILKRKRSKDSRTEERNRVRKKKVPAAPVEDEEILSDEADEPTEGVDAPPSPESPDDSEPIPENETAEEKRLRLARAYLRHVGVSEDADLKGLDSSDSEADEDDAGNKKLRQNALEKTGRSIIPLADKLSSHLSSIQPTKCKGHVLPPTCISLSKTDGLTAVSGGKDSRLIIWDVATQTRKHMFKPMFEARDKRPIKAARANGHIGAIHTTAITDDGTTVVSGGADGLIRVWDVRAGKPITTLRGHRGAINALSIRSSGKQLFSGAEDRTVKIWDLSEMAYVETLFGHGGEVTSLDAMASERAISAGRDGTLRIYKIVEGSQLLFRSSSAMSIDAVSVMSEQRFISGGDDGSIALWHLNKKRATAVWKRAHGNSLGCESWISSISAFRNTDVAVSGGGDGYLRFFKCEHVPKLRDIGSLNLGPGFVNGIAVDHHHGVIAAAVGSEHRLGRWSRIRGAKNTIQFMSVPDFT